jgi:hypothetical protein
MYWPGPTLLVPECGEITRAVDQAEDVDVRNHRPVPVG